MGAMRILTTLPDTPHACDYSPSADSDLTSRRLSNTSLDDIAHVNLLNEVGLDTRLLESTLNDDDTEVRGRESGELAVLGADRRTGSGNDENGLGRLLCQLRYL